MDIEYLYNIIDLYISNEDDNHHTNMIIEKQEQNIRFSFNMDETDFEKTVINIPLEDFTKEITNILNYYKQQILIINEEYINQEKTPFYRVFFQNGRTLSLNGFSVLEVNNARNILYNIHIESEEIRVDNINEKKTLAYQPPFALQSTGFSSYAILFIVVIFFTIVFVVALLAFNAFAN